MKALLTIIILGITIETIYCQDNNTINAIQTTETGYEGVSVYSRKKNLVKKKAPWFVQRFTITGGYFAPQNSTRVQVDGNNGAAGTRLNFEK
ncbi:MAG TPA: hypothetical protein VFW07_03500, partial [Parafilimonas sp.]|nr:hypothetical protein [Parafilimonas sp.]